MSVRMVLLHDHNRTEDGLGARSVDAAIARMAARQHGLVTRPQALSCGATPTMIRWRLDIGRWERVFRAVYRIAGSPAGWRQDAMAACLHMDAVLSCRAAAALFAISAVTNPAITVTVSEHRNRSRRSGINVRESTLGVPAAERTVVDYIPVTKPARLLQDLAATEDREFVSLCLDDALRKRLVSISFLNRWVAQPQRAHRKGIRVLRLLVQERSSTGPTESALESRFLRLVGASRLPAPRSQYGVFDEGRFVARVDFAYPDHRLAIEVDGFRHHDTRLTFDRERARGNALEALGWRVLRVTAAHDPETVAIWIRRALRD